MNDLIARLEAATGPDRDVDHDIAIHCYARKEFWPEEWTDHDAWPLYTASLDAALTLVPEGHDWIISNVNGHVGSTPYACVGSTREHFGGTPAIALCIAALKARAALKCA